jgi:RNA-directed DNA polymerase
MRSSSLRYVTYAIADAMLAGPAEPDSIVERMTRCLGVRSEWMRGSAREVAKRFGARWDGVDRKEVSMLVAGAPGFVAAWRSDMRPVIVQVLRRAPTQHRAQGPVSAIHDARARTAS